VKVIAHGGVARIAPVNTLASFDAALDEGAHAIEFDVRAGPRGLVLAHTRLDVLRRGCVTLDEALAHLSEPRFARLELNVDVKRPGYERETLAALRRFSLVPRALVSSQHPAVVGRVRALDPEVRTGISLGGALARRIHRWSPRGWRAAIVAAIHAGRFAALLAHHPLVDRALARAVTAAGGELYAWTVDDRALAERLARLPVTGIVTNDPGLLVARAG
jgi:glycerophosphoryl diester phosphodiesterase